MSETASPTKTPPPKRSGCMIALIVTGVITIVVVAAIAIGGYFWSRTDTGQAFLSVAQEAAKATQGQGPDALRAAGCTEALAIRYAVMNDKLKHVLADAGPNAERAFAEGTEVRCLDPKVPMTCDDVIRIFRDAEHPTDTFTAFVTASGQDRCRVQADVEKPAKAATEAGNAAASPMDAGPAPAAQP